MGLYVYFQPTNFTARHVAAFLRGLLRHFRGHVILLWDQGSIHRGPAIAAVQRAYPRLHIEEFPAYAPELNPVERVWKLLRRLRIHNQYFETLDALIAEVTDQLISWACPNETLRRLCCIT